MHRDLATLRHDVKSLRKAFNTEVDPVVRKYLEKRLKSAAGTLQTGLANGSYFVSPRTPWKKLVSPSGYFEELGK